MNIIDVNARDIPVDPINFKPLSSEKYPYCLLGFELKNQYDQLRHKIPCDYKSEDILHIVGFPEPTIFFFRGININPTSKLQKLIDNLAAFKFSLMSDTSTNTYEKLLKENNLACETCKNNMRPGVYPIDGKFINDLAQNTINLTDLYEKIFKDEDIPYFQSIGYITLYVLDSTGATPNDSTKIFEKLISDYKNTVHKH
jgi:hypothetical protein